MATTVTELYSGQGGTRSIGRSRTYTRQFRVVTTSVLSVLDTRTLAGIPQILSVHPDDPTAFCVNIVPTQPFEDKQIWEVACDYKNLQVDIQSGNESSGPTGERPKIRWTSAKFREPYEAAYIVGGTGVLPQNIGQFRVLSNSRGQPFSPPRERDITRKILTITRREASYNPDLAGTYEDSINQNQITIAGKVFAKHCGKIESITAETAFENGVLHWVVTYEIHHKRDTWNETLYDKATDADGGTVFLNGQGIALEPAELAAGTMPATTIARPYEEKDFSPLLLPATV